jgi:hypothetical protein
LLSTISAVVAQASADANVMLHPPEPDVWLSLPLNADEVSRFRNTLLAFATHQGFHEFKGPPRASGKAFFLSLVRKDDAISIIAEEKLPGDPVIIECSNIQRNATDFVGVESALERAINREWPNLVISRHWRTQP